jgi:hypothetical protein
LQPFHQVVLDMGSVRGSTPSDELCLQLAQLSDGKDELFNE